MMVAGERLYRFRVTYEVIEGGYVADLKLHEEDTPSLLQSAARMGTVSFATQAALDCVARDVGHSVRVERITGTTELPFWVGMWVAEM
jgi:hypothetical protein